MLESLSYRSGGFLKRISLRGCKTITDNSFKQVHCCIFTGFKANSASLLTSTNIIILLKKLQILFFYRFLAMSCQNLVHLNLSGCVRIGDR